MTTTTQDSQRPPLAGFQRKFLRSRAHGLQPVVWVGREGMSDAVLKEVDQALEDHELIKIKFNDHKEEKKELADLVVRTTHSDLAGMVGHVAIFYRPRRDAEKRTLVLPQRP